ncbi:MAG: hypothetical protein QOK42_1189 [Frankiaceae bacterium]|jgi:uncharacterized protein (TIGR00369 family)|nr:hypothetical protein [Frankiaceae bacterium]MDX6224078.1 hypothetical protein [Frankiales bacterium]MDX6273180.1 hypothetical protein [Frankiales bacterium]
MTMDLEAVKSGLRAAVPFVRTLGLEFDEVGQDRAVLRMPDREDLHNHVGGPHAGAMFALGESASGAVVIACFSDLLARATPLAKHAAIDYLKVARGDVTAEAVLTRTKAEVTADLDAGKTAKFEVKITLRDASAEVTGEMTVQWALRPNDR